jgi:ribonuclease HI
MNIYYLFTDASLNPGLKAGVGGYLLIDELLYNNSPERIDILKLEKNLKLRKIEDTSSTKLEVQTVLWALEEYCNSTEFTTGDQTLHIFTDSQCVDGLLSRRSGLESRSFRSRGGNRPHRNALLYKNYYTLHDRLKFTVTKVKGHTSSGSRNTVQFIFSLLDRNVRKALKSWMNGLKTG